MSTGAAETLRLLADFRGG